MSDVAILLYLSVFLFCIGALGILIRRNVLVVLMCVEMMLNGANLAFISFGRMHGGVEGQVVVLFAIAFGAAEVAVGLALASAFLRERDSASINRARELRW